MSCHFIQLKFIILSKPAPSNVFCATNGTELHYNHVGSLLQVKGTRLRFLIDSRWAHAVNELHTELEKEQWYQSCVGLK